ncbi:TniQ family protein [Paenibacillus frigoriresistens]|uniref:TniQ family protein n=1 Tax=Paenibacillus alginolyticus TaxID=59839 RepID=UPI001566756B|nr:TniQ family protein [Paenibacillus frigoriresistens]NRF91568.1 TniQ family protein [Paenibacillus frigoriresistens]
MRRLKLINKQKLFDALMHDTMEGVLKGYVFRDHFIPEVGLHQGSVKFCPMCFVDRTYYKLIWELALVTVCPNHGVLLIDHCPSCGKKLTFDQTSIRYCSCRFDFLSSRPTRVKPKETLLSSLLFKMTGEVISDFSRDTLDQNKLINLSMGELIKVMVFFSCYLPGKTESNKIKRFTRSDTNLSIHQTMIETFNIFMDWPKNFHAFLDSFEHKQRTDYFYLNQTYGINKYFGGFYRHFLNICNEIPNLEYLHAEFNSYLIKHWNGSTHQRMLTNINEKELLERRYLTMKETANYLGIDYSSVDHEIEKGILTAKVIPGKNRRISRILILTSTVLTYKKVLEESYTLKKASELLGVNAYTLKSLVRHNVICPFQGPNFDNYGKWKFLNKDISDLLFRLDDSITQKNPQSLFVLSGTNIKKIKTSLSYGEIFREVLNGNLHPTGKIEGIGLQSYVFDKEDLEQLFKQDDEKMA